jgi:hypothetical protein
MSLSITLKQFMSKGTRNKFKALYTLLEETEAGDISTVGNGDTDSTKIEGFVTSRNAADNSMYVPVTDSSGLERLWKLASQITANAGGYFETLYINTKVAAASTMAGIVRGMESKLTVEGNMGNGAEGSAILAKVNVSGATAEIASAIGLDVLLEEESSGTITKGTGVRVQGGAGAIDFGVDVSGDYRQAGLKQTIKDSAGITDEALTTAFGITEAVDATAAGFIGYARNTSDSNKIYPVYLILGQFFLGAEITAAA